MSLPHRLFGLKAHHTTASLIHSDGAREQNRVGKFKSKTFHSLIPEVISHCYCCVFFLHIQNESVSTSHLHREEMPQGCEEGIMGAIAEADALLGHRR